MTAAITANASALITRFVQPGGNVTQYIDANNASRLMIAGALMLGRHGCLCRMATASSRALEDVNPFLPTESGLHNRSQAGTRPDDTSVRKALALLSGIPSHGPSNGSTINIITWLYAVLAAAALVSVLKVTTLRQGSGNCLV